MVHYKIYQVEIAFRLLRSFFGYIHTCFAVTTVMNMISYVKTATSAFFNLKIIN